MRAECWLGVRSRRTKKRASQLRDASVEAAELVAQALDGGGVLAGVAGCQSSLSSSQELSCCSAEPKQRAQAWGQEVIGHCA